MRCLVIIVMLAFPTVAVAQDDGGEQTKEATATFQALFDAGSEAYTNQEYGRAVTLWQKAYRVRPEAAALYNAARAAQKRGNFEQALSLSKRAGAAEKYPLSDAVKSRNAALQEQLRAQIEEKKAREAAAAKKGLDVRGWSGVATAGVGLVGVLVGTGVYGPKVSDAGDRAEEAEYYGDYERHIDDMRAAKRTGWTLVYSGSALVLVGAGLVTWDLLDGPETPEVSVGPGGPAGSSGAFLKVNF